MRKPTKSAHTPSAPPTFVSLLSGWVQQGVESFFATQRILVDIAMRQNTAATKNLHEGIFHPEHSPVAILPSSRPREPRALWKHRKSC